MNNRHGLPASTEHLYEIVKMDLRTGVLDGSFPPDTRIPSEVELMDRYGVSRITVRHAINELVQEGYLVKRHGTGTFVLPRKHDRHVVSINSFTMDCLASGLTPRTEVLSLGRGRATESAAGFLNIAPGSGVILLDRLRYINDERSFWKKTPSRKKWKRSCGWRIIRSSVPSRSFWKKTWAFSWCTSTTPSKWPTFPKTRRACWN